MMDEPVARLSGNELILGIPSDTLNVIGMLGDRVYELTTVRQVVDAGRVINTSSKDELGIRRPCQVIDLLS